ncbi:MAG: hypothetical protein AAGB11_16545 [Pseudomonadota bacterium]
MKGPLAFLGALLILSTSVAGAFAQTTAPDEPESPARAELAPDADQPPEAPLAADPKPLSAEPQPQEEAEAATQQDGEAPHFGFAPSADVLIDSEIVPVLTVMSDRALKLQNAVIRHCVSDTNVTRRELLGHFRSAIIGTAEVIPLSFGSDAARAVPARLLTEAASTVFSRTRLEAMMNGLTPAPQTLEELRQEEPALMGLSALERLLLATNFSSGETIENRCQLAVPIAASIRISIAFALESWRTRAVAVHWQGDEVELADRLRLRDMIQGTIDAVDRFERDVSEFSRQSRNNGELPFTQERHGEIYMLAMTRSLCEQVERLKMFADPASDAEAALTEITNALEVGKDLLVSPPDPEEAAYIVAFDQAHADIIDRLPAIFGFDASAFNRAITSFELQRPETRADVQ